MTAQELLTGLISGLQNGLIVYLVFAFVEFGVRRGGSVVPVAEDAGEELPSLAELFEMADRLCVDGTGGGAEGVRLGVKESAQDSLLAEAEGTEDELPEMAGLGIRELKALAREAKIPRYGRMTKQLLIALEAVWVRGMVALGGCRLVHLRLLAVLSA